ncbi:50S ribosomal protein L23 [Desulfovibrio sp. OttesenSCG-928-I05]|nr:50S ribosomal protein L23 [Desulfovibrio sp. OttesenSCG-928-I05]
MDYSQILIKPLVSEKSTFLRDGSGQVAFYVSPRANKIEIGRAVEEAFKVKVTQVRVVSHKPLARVRQGRVVGTVAGYKKAYVTLAPGDKIEFFEGV